MKKRTDKKSSVTINIFSNLNITIDGKTGLAAILCLVALIYALVVLGIEPETHVNLFRSLIVALFGS